MLGAGLLWFGWFGFNAGSNLEANALTAVALINTVLAPAAGALAWALGERITRNVRKLVRREIHRALTSQDLE